MLMTAAPVEEAVQDGGGDDAVAAEQFGPCRQAPVGRHDRGGAVLVATVDDLEEGVGLGPVERGDPDVVDDEHRRSGVGADLGRERAVGVGGAGRRGSSSLTCPSSRAPRGLVACDPNVRGVSLARSRTCCPVPPLPHPLGRLRRVHQLVAAGRSDSFAGAALNGAPLATSPAAARCTGNRRATPVAVRSQCWSGHGLPVGHRRDAPMTPHRGAGHRPEGKGRRGHGARGRIGRAGG